MVPISLDPVFQDLDAMSPGLAADQRLVGWLRRSVPLVGLASIGFGALVLVGWGLHISVLTHVPPGSTSMKPNTALCLMLFGASLLLGSSASAWSGRRRAAARGCAWGALVVGLLTLAEHVMGVDLFLDRALLGGATGKETAHPGRMAPNTSAALVLLAVAQILLLIRRGPMVVASQAMCLAAGSVGLLGMYGYLFRVPELGRFLGLPGMPGHIAMATILLSLATFFTLPTDGLARLVTARGPSAMLTRCTLAATLVVPPAVGWLLLHLLDQDTAATRLGVALVAFANVVVFSAISFVAGFGAAGLEVARDRAVAHDRSVSRLAAERQRAADVDLQTLAAIVESSDDAIIGKTLDGTMTAWNPGAERMYGYTAAEAIGTHISILAGPAGTVEISGVLALIAAGRHVDHYETQRTHKDGTIVDVSIAVSPIYANGAVVGASAVARDVSARKRDEARQRATEERTQAAQRMESLGQLAGGIAHDFNNLLAVIMNFTAFAIEQTTGDSSVQADLSKVRIAADRAAGLTHQLLLFTRGETATPVIMDVNGAIAEAHAMLARTIGENIEMIAVPATQPLMIFADSGQIQQVLINLAVNARDAMPDGGTLVIEGTMTDLDEYQTDIQPALPPGRYVRLLVSDTGTGMSKEIATHMFEPFYTGKPIGQGTGLGLATVYGIVTDAGGSLNVYSELNLGTTIRVYFPVASKPSTSASAAPDAEPQRGQGQMILVVDDEDAIGQMVTRILENNGYRVLCASGGTDALALDAERRCDLLLTDAIMPAMSGRRLAELLRRRHPRVPVLFMSGYSDGLRNTQITADEATGFIEKPFTARNLLRQVQELLTHTEAHVSAAPR